MDNKTPFEKWVDAYDSSGSSPGFMRFFTSHQSGSASNRGNQSPSGNNRSVNSYFNFENVFRGSAKSLSGRNAGENSPIKLSDNPMPHQPHNHPIAPFKALALDPPVANDFSADLVMSSELTATPRPTDFISFDSFNFDEAA